MSEQALVCTVSVEAFCRLLSSVLCYLSLRRVTQSNPEFIDVAGLGSQPALGIPADYRPFWHLCGTLGIRTLVLTFRCMSTYTSDLSA